MRRAALLPALVALVGAGGCAASRAAPADRAARPATPAAPAADLGRAAALVSGPADGLARSCEAAVARGRTQLAALDGGAPAAAGEPAATLGAYDAILAGLNDANDAADLARNASPDPAVRAAAERCNQAVQALLTDVSLDRRLYDRLRALDLGREDPATRHWMERDLREFRRAGVDRDEATRARVKGLQDELVTIGQEFNRNIRTDVRRVEVEPAELAGLPEDYVKAHPPGPAGKVALTTDYPDYFPFLTYARSARAREALWRAFHTRAAPANLAVLSRMLARRHELATLLGYASWADYATENKMMGTGHAAGAFIDRIAAAAAARAEEEKAALLARKRQDVPGAERLEAWDVPYYTDRVKAERLGFDSQAARPYFPFERVRDGVLEVAGRLFDVSFRKVDGAAVWHPDVAVYDVVAGRSFAAGEAGGPGALLGRVYLDLHPREGKYKHAAQYTLVTGQAGARLPEGVLLCNFPKGGATPGLMEHAQVRTLFHEFGHLLHHVLGGHTRWASLSGVRTEWDFVEAPSQLLEEWIRDEAVLRGFARHHATGEPIPAELVARLRAAEEWGKGVDVRRQMFLAATSLRLHDGDPSTLDPTRTVDELMDRYSPVRHVPGAFLHASFGHLESYGATYYTYMWSLVIAKDLFTPFQARGLFDPETAARYRRTILEPGGGKPAAELVRDFLGRPYDFRAYERWLAREPGAASARAAPAGGPR